MENKIIDTIIQFKNREIDLEFAKDLVSEFCGLSESKKTAINIGYNYVFEYYYDDFSMTVHLHLNGKSLIMKYGGAPKPFGYIFFKSDINLFSVVNYFVDKRDSKIIIIKRLIDHFILFQEIYSFANVALVDEHDISWLLPNITKSANN